jgi:hypothetical protein
VSPSRRHVLRGGVGLAVGYLLAGCGRHGSSGLPSPLPSSSSPAPPLSGAGRDAIGSERALLGAYEAVLARFPNLAASLALPQAHHRAHLLALGDQPTSTTSPIVVPVDARAAVEALIGLELAAAAQRQGAAVGDPNYGSLLASIAGAEAVHVDLLTYALPAIKAAP